MRVSLVIPYIDSYDTLIPTIQAAEANAGAEFELVLINNGSQSPLPDELKGYKTFNNPVNVGVVKTFEQGYTQSTGDIIFFIHSDVLIHEENWVDRLVKAFEADPKLGLGGLFGARAIGENGGRSDCYSNMLGKVWGKCDCHSIAGLHHGNITQEVTPASVLDGLGMAFREEALRRLVDETDMFAEWRSPHHFYDKILSLKVAKLGYHVAVVPLAFDHFSGATSVRGDTYKTSLRPWLRKFSVAFEEGAEDSAIYNLAESQMFGEFGSQFPITVDANYNYYARGASWPT